MSDGIYAAMSGAVARSTALDVLGNNIANAPSTAFRIDAVAFREEPTAPPDGAPRPDGDLRMATVDAVVPSWRPGSLEQTGEALDVAIDGDGLLPVRTDDGIRYVRGGSLQRDSDGTLMTAAGHPLVDRDGVVVRLPLEGGETVIGEDGTIRVGEEDVATLPLVWFDNVAMLAREGDNLWSAPAGATPRAADGRIRQGYLEGTNGNVVRGMVDMIAVTRSYEATVRAMETFREIDRRTARDLAGS